MIENSLKKSPGTFYAPCILYKTLHFIHSNPKRNNIKTEKKEKKRKENPKKHCIKYQTIMKLNTKKKNCFCNRKNLHTFYTSSIMSITMSSSVSHCISPFSIISRSYLIVIII